MMIARSRTVFLDASSTALQMVKYLDPQKDNIIITNSLKVLELAANKNITAYGTGGRLLASSNAFIGSKAEDAVRDLHPDYFFFSSQGIDKNGTIYDYSESETKLRQILIRNSEKSYFLCDKSKVGKKYLFSVCTLKDIAGVISDEKIEFEDID